MKTIIKVLKSTSLFILIGGSNLFAQVNDSTNFRNFYNDMVYYYDSTGLDTIPGSGFKDLSRWGWYWNNRTGNYDENNNSFLPEIIAKTSLTNSLLNSSLFSYSLEATCNESNTFNENWEYAGHNYDIEGTREQHGIGRLLKVAMSPETDTYLDTLYVGSNTSGIWKTNNANADIPIWTNLTDYLRIPVFGVNDIAIDPSSSQIIYIGTGAPLTWGATSGIGILKSIDAGDTWQPTGLTSDGTILNFVVNDIEINPLRTNTILATVNKTIKRSTNGGNTFIDVFTTSYGDDGLVIRDIKYDLVDTNIVYATTHSKNYAGKIFKSTDAGLNWTDVTSFSPNTCGNYDIALKKIILNSVPTTLIYVLGNYAGSPVKKHLFVSNNQCSTFTKISETFYRYYARLNDFEIAPYPTSGNDESFYYCDYNLHHGSFKYNTGTSSYDITSVELSHAGDDYYHVDIQDVEIVKKTGTNDDYWVYIATDGGIFRSDKNNHMRSLNGKTLRCTEHYGFDITANGKFLITGLQDMGAYALYNNEWHNRHTGDGYRAVMDKINKQGFVTDYGASYYRWNGKNNNFSFPSYLTLPASTFEISLEFDNKRLYFGDRNTLRFVDNVYKSSPQIYTIGNFPYYSDVTVGEFVSAIAVAPSDNNYIYAGFQKPTWGALNNRLYRTTNARDITKYDSTTKDQDADWQDITPGLEGYGKTRLTDIVVHPQDPLKLWVSFGGYWDDVVENVHNFKNNKIYYSANGGTTWTEVSENLPVFPVNTLALVDGTEGALYAGTDLGVYYNPNATDPNSEWVCFMGGMPIAVVSNLKIDHCNNKLYASTYGRGIWKANLAETENNPMVISSNTTWDYPRIINYDIIINSGITLTIKSEIRFAKYKKIIINPGAKLVADGALLTNSCDGDLWNGIVVVGDDSKSQIPFTNQGFADIKNNSIIENAINGVRVIGYNNDGTVNPKTCRGIVRAINSTFRNNQTDILLWGKTASSLGQPQANVSYIKKCNFYTTDANAVTKLGEHVNLSWCNNITMQGCKFEDQRTGVNPKSQGRIGINGSEASFNINSYDNGLGTITTTEFIKLNQAIKSVSVPSDSRSNIIGCTTNCYKGFYLLKNTNTRAISNVFTIKDDQFISDATNYPYGIYLDATSLFDIEGNTYHGSRTTSSKKGGHAGLMIRNSGANTNTFYRSFFDNLTVASEAVGENKDGGNKEKGLKFRCNEYADDIKDLQVLVDPVLNVTAPTGMAVEQGSTSLPADNLFGNSSLVLKFNIDNGVRVGMTYYHPNHNIFSRALPSRIVNTSLKEVAINERTCDDNLVKSGSGWPSSKRSELTTLETFMSPANSVWISKIDNGNNPTNVVNDIETATLGNALGVYNQLMIYSPWLSMEALGALAVKESVFTDLQIRNVMIANPQAGRSDWIKSLLENRNTPLDPSYIDDIVANADSLTDRDSLSWEVSRVNTDYDLLLNDLIGWYLNDTIEHLETLDTLLTHPYNPMYRYQLAAIYFERGMYSEYQNVLDSIPAQIDLNDKETEYLSTFNDLYDEIKLWKQDSMPLPLLDSTQLVWLKDFYEEHPDMPGIGHALLAINDSDYVIADPVYITDTTVYSGSEPFMGNTGSINDKQISKLLKVYPNPTTRQVTFELLGNRIEQQKMTITITDEIGKVILTKVWNTNQKMIKIDLQAFPSGIYYGQISANEKILETHKIMLTK